MVSCLQIGEEFMPKALTNNQFKDLLRSKFGDKLDYSDVKYETLSSEITLKCLKHDYEFTNKAVSLRRSKAVTPCPLCNARGLKNRDWFISKARETHGNEYDYSKVVYKNYSTKVIIIHNGREYHQTPHMHIQGYKPELNTSITNVHNTDTFIKKAKEIHGDKYDYSKSIYVTSKSKLTVICEKHGEFAVSPNQHISRTSDCPKCAHKISRGEIEIEDYLSSIGVKFQTQNKTSIGDGRHLDLYIEANNFAIEFNGNYWHSEKMKSKFYHQTKYSMCKDKGITLLQIWEYQWSNPQTREILKSIIRHNVGLSKRIHARKLTKVKRLDFHIVKNFYKDNHLQSHGNLKRSNQHYGLCDTNGNVIAAMSVEQSYLSRMCFKNGIAVAGGVSRLLSMLPSGEYYTYCNLDLGGDGSQYKCESKVVTTPSMKWCKQLEVFNRESVQKHKLKGIFDDYDGSNSVEFLHSKGYYRLYNAGNLKLTFKV